MQKFIFIYGFLLKLFDIFKSLYNPSFLQISMQEELSLCHYTVCHASLMLNLRLSADCTGQWPDAYKNCQSIIVTKELLQK